MATRAEIRAFLDRPWERVREAKDRYLAALIAREGTDTAFRLAAMLRDHAAAMGARTSDDERAADLAAAIDLRRKLDRASRRRRRIR